MLACQCCVVHSGRLEIHVNLDMTGCALAVRIGGDVHAFRSFLGFLCFRGIFLGSLEFEELPVRCTHMASLSGMRRESSLVTRGSHWGLLCELRRAGLVGQRDGRALDPRRELLPVCWVRVDDEGNLRVELRLRVAQSTGQAVNIRLGLGDRLVQRLLHVHHVRGLVQLGARSERPGQLRGLAGLGASLEHLIRQVIEVRLRLRKLDKERVDLALRLQDAAPDRRVVHGERRGGRLGLGSVQHRPPAAAVELHNSQDRHNR